VCRSAAQQGLCRCVQEQKVRQGRQQGEAGRSLKRCRLIRAIFACSLIMLVLAYLMLTTILAPSKHTRTRPNLSWGLTFLTCIASGGTWEACLQRGSLHTSQAAMVVSLQYCTPAQMAQTAALKHWHVGTGEQSQAVQHLPRCSLHLHGACIAGLP